MLRIIDNFIFSKREMIQLIQRIEVTSAVVGVKLNRSLIVVVGVLRASGNLTRGVEVKT